MAGMTDNVRIGIAWTTDPWAVTTTYTEVANISAAERAKRGITEITLTKRRNGAGGGTFQPGQLSVTFRNRDGDFDQANSGSVFGVANLVRNKKIRMTVSDDAYTGSSELFVGYIDDIIPSGTNIDAVATVTASDISRLLAEYDVVDLVRPVEFSGVRAQAILTEVGVPAGEQGTIDNGTVLMPAATLASDAWSLLQQCAKAEYGTLYVTRDGKINFLERYAMLEDAAFSTRQHSFTEAGGVNSLIRMAPTARTLGSIHNVTRVTASRIAGDTTFEYDTTAANEPPVTATDSPHGLSVEYDADVEVAAQAWHRGWDFTDQRMSSFEVLVYPPPDGVSTGALTAIEAGNWEPLTRVEVQTKPIGYGTDWNFEGRIEGYSHTINASEWTATVDVSPYETDWQVDGSDVWYEYGNTLSAFDLGAL